MTATNPTACLLVIGNEVLSGRTQDLNIKFLATRLGEIGIPVREVRVIPDVAWDELGHVDLFLHPGGQTGPLLADDEWLARVRDLRSTGALMTSVCNGAVVYGKAGLLDGRPAATHWSAVQALRDLGVAVDENARFVDDGDVVTSAGVSAGIDMSLHLVQRLDSTEAAKAVRRYIQYDPAPPV